MKRVPRTLAGKAKIPPVLPSAVFLEALKQRGMPQPFREYQFAPPRLFRADYAWPAWNLLCEVEGGVFTRQAHGSVSGILRDMEKYTLAAVHGYRVVRCLPKDLCSEEFLTTLKLALDWHSP